MNEKQILELLSNMPKKNNKWNYSKLLMSVITILFTITFLVSLVMFASGAQYPTELLSSIEDIFMVGFVAYSGKAGVENFLKIRKSKKENYIIEEGE